MLFYNVKGDVDFLKSTTVSNALQTSAHVVLGVSRNLRSRCLWLVFRCILWLKDTSYSKCLKGQIRTCLLGTRWYTLYLCTATMRATMHSVTDRQTDWLT